MPVSKPFLFFMKENKDAVQFVVENHAGYREFTGNRTQFIFANSSQLCERLFQVTDFKMDPSWLRKWKNMNHIAKKHILSSQEEKMTEGEAVRSLFEVTPNDSYVYVANSMPIRDVDSFMLNTEKI